MANGTDWIDGLLVGTFYGLALLGLGVVVGLAESGARWAIKNLRRPVYIHSRCARERQKTYRRRFTAQFLLISARWLVGKFRGEKRAGLERPRRAKNPSSPIYRGTRAVMRKTPGGGGSKAGLAELECLAPIEMRRTAGSEELRQRAARHLR